MEESTSLFGLPDKHTFFIVCRKWKHYIRTYAGAVWNHERKQNCQNAACERQCAPEQSFEGSRHCIRRNWTRWGNVFARPNRNASVVVTLNLLPACECHERFVVRIVHEDVLQAVMRSVSQHHAQRFHTGRTEILCARQLGGAVVREFWQQAGRVIFAVNTVRVSVCRNLRQGVAESKSQITIPIMTVTV